MARGRVAGPAKAKKPREAKPKAIRHEILTDEKWATLKPYGSFVVPDPEGGEGHKFMIDETAAILPHNRSPGSDLDDPDYWIAKIKDIRAELHDDETNTVWVRVQWFYSGKDVSDVVKSFDVSAVGKYERIISDHFDILGPECFNGVVPVVKFNEQDPEPPFIAWDKFFRRYTFQYKARSLKPKPGTSSCACKLPYNPNDLEPSSVMHFCPRPSCRKAYHHGCLMAAKSKESSTTAVKASSSKSTPEDTIVLNPPQRKHARATRSGATDKPSTKMKKEPDHEPTLGPNNPIFSRSFRLLACSPDTDDNVDLASLVSSAAPPINDENEDEDSDTVISQPPKKKLRGRPSVGKNSQRAVKTRQSIVKKSSRTLADALEDLPSDLLHVAEQPLVRGGAFRNGGVSGNIVFVTRARRLVYQLLQGIPSPEKWEDVVFGKNGDASITNAIVKIGTSKKQLPHFVCPHCKSAI